MSPAASSVPWLQVAIVASLGVAIGVGAILFGFIRGRRKRRIQQPTQGTYREGAVEQVVVGEIFSRVADAILRLLSWMR